MVCEDEVGLLLTTTELENEQKMMWRTRLPKKY